MFSFLFFLFIRVTIDRFLFMLVDWYPIHYTLLRSDSTSLPNHSRVIKAVSVSQELELERDLTFDTRWDVEQSLSRFHLAQSPFNPLDQGEATRTHSRHTWWPYSFPTSSSRLCTTSIVYLPSRLDRSDRRSLPFTCIYIFFRDRRLLLFLVAGFSYLQTDIDTKIMPWIDHYYQDRKNSKNMFSMHSYTTVARRLGLCSPILISIVLVHLTENANQMSGLSEPRFLIGKGPARRQGVILGQRDVSFSAVCMSTRPSGRIYKQNNTHATNLFDVLVYRLRGFRWRSRDVVLGSRGRIESVIGLSDGSLRE